MPSDPGKPNPTERPPLADPARPIRVLVADDNADYLKALLEFLGRFPRLKVESVARNGREAVQLAGATPPDLVLLDHMMPELKGAEAARLIKQQHPNTKIVLVTLHNLPEYRIRAEESGADEFVPKEQFFTRFPALLEKFFQPGSRPAPPFTLSARLSTKTRQLNHGATIVIINDEVATLRLFEHHLAEAGYRVFTAETGTAGLALVRQELPDLVLLDIRLPDADGRDLCRQIKQEPLTSRIIIVLASGSLVQENDVATGMAGGADAYLTLPTRPAELLLRVDALVRIRRLEHGLQTHACLYDHLFEDSSAAMVQVSPQNRILTANPACASLLAAGRDWLCGRCLTDFASPASVEDLLGALTTARTTGQVVPATELRLRRKDDRTFPVRVTAIPHADTPGEISRVLLLLEDTSGQHEADDKVTGILETAPDAVVIADEAGRIVRVNRQTETLFGYTRAELLGQPVELLLPEDQQAGHARQRASYMTEPDFRPMAGRELQARSKAGDRVPVEIGISFVETPGGRLFTAVIRDLRERLLIQGQLKQTVERLHQENARHEAIARLGQQALAGDGFAQIADAAIQLCRQMLKAALGAVFRVTDSSPALLLEHGDGWEEGLPGRARFPGGRESPDGFALLQRAPVIAPDLGTEKRFQVPALLSENGIQAGVSLIIPDGTPAFGTLSLYWREPTAIGVGDIHFLQGIVNLLAQCLARERAEKSLRDSEAMYHSLVEHLPVMVFRKDLHGQFVYANEKFCRFLGRPLAALVGHSDFDFFPRELAIKYLIDDRWVMERRESLECIEETRRAGSGESSYLQTLKAPVLDSDGEVTGVEGILLDVTERRRLQLESHRASQSQKAVLDSLPAHIAVLAADGRITRVNAAWRRFAADNQLLTPDAATGTNYLDACAGDGSGADSVGPRVAAGIRRVLAGEEERFELEYECSAPGVPRWFRTLVSPLGGGADAGAVVMHVDITEQRLVEARLQQAQKMEALGRLAGGVAHDFNNLLVVIRGNADMLAHRLAGTGANLDELNEIEGAIDRAAAMTRQLLLYSRKQSPEARELDLNAVIENALKMLRRMISANLTVRCELAPDLPAVLADPGLIEQVLMNLAVNAGDAMPGGGDFTIRTGRVELTEVEAATIPGARAGTFVRLSTSDTGAGIQPEIRARLFEPFFTTKERGRGTGLGLATVESIAKLHQGWVGVESEPGCGATFHVHLPAASGPARDDAKEQAARPLRGNGEGILLVEDEADVLKSLVLALERLGYRVWPAASAEQARAAWRENRDRVALVIADLVLPGRENGHHLAAAFRAESPGLKVLLTSGYSGDSATTSLPPDTRFLQKPYTLAELSRRIREFLDSAPGPSEAD